jgi:hypothetical protein
MNVNMHARLHGLSHTGNAQSQLEEDIQLYADAIATLQENGPGNLESASAYQARIRQETIAELHEY